MSDTTIETEIMQLDPNHIKLLAVNARFMRHEVFQRLVANIIEDGGLLGNTPFCWLYRSDEQPHEPIHTKDKQDVFEVISGNHRVKAARAAGLNLIDVEVTKQYIEPERRRAIQLSQNAITGEDDPVTLKQIYEDIDNVAFRMYSGLDDKTLNLMKDVSVESLSEANLAFQTIALTFLPHEVAEIEEVWKLIKDSVAGRKAHWLARWQEYDMFLDALEAAGTANGVKNTATALMVVLEVFHKHIDDLTPAFLDENGEAKQAKRAVPVAAIIGDSLMKAEDFAIIKRKLDDIVKHSGGEIKNSTEALLSLCKAENVNETS